MKRRGKAIKQRAKVARRVAATKVRPARPPAKARPATATGLLRELNAALEQLTATSEVLRIISSTPGELEPVFETMLKNAVRICGASFGTIYRAQGDALRVVTTYNAPPGLAEARRSADYRPAAAKTPLGDMLATKAVVHVVDMAAHEGYVERRVPALVSTVELGGVRTWLAVPILKDGELIGAFVLYRQRVRPFTDKQISLVTSFAAQAVIAIENARLLSELRELLERQTATSEVLGVISRSKFELQPILESVVDTAMRLCRAEQAVLFRHDRGIYRFAAGHSAIPAYLEIERQHPISPGQGTVVGRAAMTRQVARIDDAWTDPLYEQKDDAKFSGVRSMIGVPLMREDEPLGVIALARNRVEPFTDREIELVATFADQAVIAIENVRLFEAEQQRTRELTELLQQQTATAKVLQVISSSTFDLQTVLNTLTESGVRLCEADAAAIWRADDGVLAFAAQYGGSTEFEEFAKNNPIIPTRGGVTGRAFLDGRTVHVPDILAEPEFTAGAYYSFGKYRSSLGVPLLRNGETIGVLLAVRTGVKPFTDKQIELLTTFADQAVIAIENVRLFEAEQQRTRELTESLEQQTATSEVLQVISSSPGDLEPVFDAVLGNAIRICEANFGVLALAEGDLFRVAPMHNAPPAFAELRRREPTFRLSSSNPVARVVATKQFLHISNLAEDAAYKEGDPAVTVFVELAGARTLLVVPMLKESELIGVFAVYRQEVRSFTDKHIDLVKNFAAQAVIAIENTRLLNELRQRTDDLTELLEQQTATSEVLGVISLRREIWPRCSKACCRMQRGSAGPHSEYLFLRGTTTHFRFVALHNAPPALTELRHDARH